MKRLAQILGILLPLAAVAATPVYEIDLDVQNTTKPFSVGYLYTYDMLQIRANVLQDGVVWTNSGYGGYFAYFLDGYGSTNYIAVSAVATNNYFTFTNGANTFYTNGNFLCMVVLTNATETKTWGHGTLKVQRNPATSGGSLSPIGGTVNWGVYSGYQNTSNSGPVRAGAGITPTINADGSMTIAVDAAVTASYATVTAMVAGDLAGSNYVAAATNTEAAARIAGDLAATNHTAAATNGEAVARIAADLAGTNYVDAATNAATIQFIASDLAGSNNVAQATNAVLVTATNEAIEAARTITQNATGECVQVSGDTMTGNLIGETNILYALQARDSAGIDIRANNGSTCATYGSGGGCQVIFTDGATFGGLVQPASLTVTGQTTLAKVNISGPQTNTGMLAMNGGNIAIGTNSISLLGSDQGLFVGTNAQGNVAIGVGTNAYVGRINIATDGKYGMTNGVIWDGDTGMYEGSANFITFVGGGNVRAFISATYLGSGTGTTQPALRHSVTGSVTQPSILPVLNDGDTGMYQGGANVICLTAGGTNAFFATNSASASQVLVGLGTNNPTARLHVNGSAIIEGVQTNNSTLAINGIIDQANTTWDDIHLVTDVSDLGGLTKVVHNTTSNTFDFASTCTTNFSDDHLKAVGEFPHGYATNTPIHPHIHFIQRSTDHTNGLWYARYRLQTLGRAVSDWVDIGFGTNEFAYSAGQMNQYYEFPAVALPSNNVVSSILEIGVWRTAGVGTGTVSLQQIGAHYEQRWIGSATEMSH